MQDFTTGPPVRKLLIFAVPFIVSTVLQNLYGAADSVIVGRYVGETAMAAVGTTTAVTSLVLMFMSGATLGMSVVAAQFRGAGDTANLKRTVSTSMYLITLLSLLFGAVGIVLAEPLLRLIQVPPEALDDAVRYLRIIFFGSVATAYYNMANSLSRAMGDSMTPMVVLVIASVLNIGLNLLFVARFAMGVAGVGYATVIATALSAVASWALLLRKIPLLQLRGEDWRPTLRIAGIVARVGLPSALQTSSLSLGRLLMQSMVNGFGTTVMAAFSAATKIEAFISYPPGGITGGMQIFTGQNVGANKLERVHLGYRGAALAVLLYSVASGAVMCFFGRELVALFDPDNVEMARIGGIYLVWSGIGVTFCGILELSKSTLIGAGDTASSVYATITDMGVRLAAAFFLSRTAGLGYVGLFLGTPIGWLVASALSYGIYKQGRWKRKRIAAQTPPTA